MSKLQLLLLGHFECLLPSGERISLSMRKAEMLLAFLALAPGIRHPRERLINLLWSDRGEEQARNSLRQCLSAIRKSLGEVADLVLQVDRTSVCLKPEMIDIDALEFERLATLAEFESLSDAAALYRGEFLEGITIRDAASQEWLDSERGRFKRQYIEILTNLGHTQLASHDFSAAIRTAENLVAQDALGESGWRLLMRAYSDNGDRSHALQAFKRCQQALRNELEVEPETATLELRERIAANQSQTAPAPETTPVGTADAKAAAFDNGKPLADTKQGDSHSIAVLPFDNLSGDPEQEYFSDGITDSIILNLALFPNLLVKSRHSSFAFKQQIKSPGEISAELNVDYLVEGSIRKSGDRIRITVQLIEATSGTQVWGKRYDAGLENLFDLEEELSRTIAATVTGQIESELRRIAIGKSAEDQQSYDLLLAGRYHANRYNRQDNLIAIDKLNQCILQDPDNVHAHTQLGACHSMDYLDRWTLDYEKSFELAKQHNEKAMALNPELEQVRSNYAEFLVFAGELDEAGRQIDKVLQINPNNPETLAVKAVVLIVQEDFEGGLQAAERALELDPYHPWVEWEVAGAQYWTGRYQAALETISAMRTDPGFTYLYAAASHAKLGHEETARKLLQEFLRGCEQSMLSMPRTREEWLDYCQSGYRFKNLELHQDMVDCLVQVGLTDGTGPASGSTPADTHNIAVLPFDNLSGDPEQEYFSDGISESIILHLNLFPGLVVKSRNSSFAFKQKIKTLGEISEELGVDYLVEGSLRKSKDQVRITVQLVEAASGNQVWGKRYDAPMEDLFDLEEELSRTVAATVTGQIEADLQRIAISKGAAGQQAYDLLLSGIYHGYRFNRQENVIAAEKLEQCLAQDPDNARAHAYAYMCHSMNYMARWSTDFQASFEHARIHIEKAMQLDPDLVPVRAFYAEYLSLCGKPVEAHRQLDKVLEANPNDTDALAMRANCLGLQGDFENSLRLAEQVYRMDPYHPWAEWELASGQYHSGEYEAALETVARFRSSPDFTYIWVIASHVRLGQTDSARKALVDFLEVCREEMLSMPQDLEDWLRYVYSSYPYDDMQYSQDLVDCMVQAGLEDHLGTSVSGGPASSHSIAVLPFDNLSGDPEQEYFSDGITDSIILNLSLFPDLSVKSRNASFAFKQQLKSAGEISRELDVDYVVEGSIRKSDNRIRITVQLIEGKSGNQIWGKRFDAGLDNLFDLEEELSRSIAATVTGQIESDLQRIAIGKGAANMQAYDLLLAGAYHLAAQNMIDNQTAIAKLNKCLELDPENARAHVVLYYCHMLNLMDRWIEDFERSRKLAEDHILEAVSLDPGSDNVLIAHADYLTFRHRYEESERQLRKVVERNPGNAEAIAQLAVNLSNQGKPEAALEQAELAIKLDPYQTWYQWIKSESLVFCERYEDCLATIGDIAHPPGFIRIYTVVSQVRLGRLEQARESLGAFLDFCREHMAAMPRSIAEWRQYYRDNAPMADPATNDSIIDCLVQAGLGNADGSSDGKAATDAHTIAVLPFDNLSGDPAQEYFSDGITESIIMHLGQFPELAVKSRNSSFAFKQQIKGLGEISTELGVAYLVEGSIRKSTEQIRVTVQLIEAASGNQVWGKRYDAPLDDLFNLEEELSRGIAATVTGQIESDLQRIALAKGARDQQAYDLLLAGIYHNQRYTREDTAIAIEKLSQCLQKDPDNVTAQIWLYVSHLMDYLDRWSPDHLNSFELAAQHINRARQLAPRNPKVQIFYAQYLVFLGELNEAKRQLEKLVSVYPDNPTILTTMALNLVLQGKAGEALDFAKRACELDPYHPWAEWEVVDSQYIAGQYEDALKTYATLRTTPAFMQIFSIAANVKLGRESQARLELQSLLDECKETMHTVPRSTDEWLTFTRENYPFADEQYNRDIIDCLVEAGLEDEPAADTEPLEQVSILVLPFSNLSGDPEQDYFSDGITESIIVNLGSFSGLRVKSRHASFAFRDSDRSIDDIADELGVKYVVEGSIRKFADKVRITVQLADATSGNQVWGRRFDSELVDLLDLEQELSRTIAGTVIGRIDRATRQAAMRKPAKDLRSYDLLMRGSYHIEHFSTKDNSTAMSLFEKCLELDPDNALAHAYLGMAHLLAMIENFTDNRAASMENARHYLTRAVELNPDDADIHAYLAEYQMYCKNFDLAQSHARKSIELNPTLADGYSVLAWHAASTGQHDEAVEYADRSMQIDQFHPYVGWNAGEVYRVIGEYEKAIKTFRSIPHVPLSVHAQIAVCFAGLGRIDEARVEMGHYLEMAPQQMFRVPTNATEWRSFWDHTVPYQDAAEAEKFFGLMLQAGLCDETDQPGDGMPSIVVLPFANLSGDIEQEYFSDGITSSLILSLGMFKGLNVKSRASSFAFKQRNKPAADIAHDLAADFLVEGSIRKSGNKVRLAVQLVETETDTQVWGKQYDAELVDILDLEQELSATIAATISGRIGHRIQQSSLNKPANSLKSFDYLLRGLYHMGKFTAKDMQVAQQQIEKCIELDPDNGEAHMQLGMIHSINYYENWTQDRDRTLELSGIHLEKALVIAPDNAQVQAYYGEYLYMLRDFERAEFHVDKAIELNPTAADGYIAKADILAATRRYDEALELAAQGFRLDPNAVGSGWVAGEVYRITGHYEKAIRTFRSIQHPPTTIHALIAACQAGLGKPGQARSEMQLFLGRSREEMPHYPDSRPAWRQFWKEATFFENEQDFEDLFALLLQAGLCEETEPGENSIPSIAVLPFENLSDDSEQAFFADGITADITSTLSKFRHLRIVARHSTEIYRDRKTSIADIAAEQGVRYILEGNVRRSGDRIRVSAELIDAQTEQNCWSERYDRDLDDLFAVQDEITQKITLAMKVQLDDGEMALQRSAGTSNIKAWELVLTSIDLSDTYIRQNILDARGMVKQALALDPDYSYAWVMLAWTYWQEAYSGCEPWEETLAEAEKAVQRALDMNPDDAAALNQSAFNYLARHDADKAQEYCRRSVELEPGNAEFQGLMAMVYIFVGNLELARVHERKMQSLCPVMPNWYYLIQGSIEEIDGELDKAIAFYRRGLAVEPDSPLCRYYLVHALTQRGDTAEAQNLADEIRALDAGVNGSGLVRTISIDPVVRDNFHANLAQFGLV